MRQKLLIVSIAVGVIIIGLSVFIGLRVHNLTTPVIEGHYSGVANGKGVDSINDDYIISPDKTVVLTRTFKYDGIVSDITIHVVGKWKEKANRYLLKFNVSDGDYVSSDNPMNQKGKLIRPKQFLDKEARIPKRSITENSLTIMFKREDGKDSQWRPFHFNKQ
jgi:hypothetical protein